MIVKGVSMTNAINQNGGKSINIVIKPSMADNVSIFSVLNFSGGLKGLYNI